MGKTIMKFKPAIELCVCQHAGAHEHCSTSPVWHHVTTLPSWLVAPLLSCVVNYANRHFVVQIFFVSNKQTTSRQPHVCKPCCKVFIIRGFTTRFVILVSRHFFLDNWFAVLYIYYGKSFGTLTEKLAMEFTNKKLKTSYHLFCLFFTRV